MVLLKKDILFMEVKKGFSKAVIGGIVLLVKLCKSPKNSIYDSDRIDDKEDRRNL